ncbi:MAG: hypothetical protein NTU73_11245 [Ignavibacteriae bacterium]|nr:hypothetical protein [Ignavibacteriota bacterium]
MRKSLILIFALLVMCVTQNFSFAQKDSVIDDDKLLMKVNNILPTGWSMLRLNDALVIQRDELVYVLFENRINAPVSTETREDVDKRIKEKGKLWRASYVFGFYPKLSDEKIELIKNFNDSIQQIIYALPEKFDIKHLLDKFASSKGEEIYTGITDEEKTRIEKHRIMKNKLTDELIRLPEYNSEKYSLYLDQVIGMEDQLELVYPHEVSTEMYRIRELLNENLIKVK